MAFHAYRRTQRSIIHHLASRLYSASTASSGCFAGISGLREANNWFDLAQQAESKCRALIDDIITSHPDPNRTVPLLDEVSDTLCQVLDAAEFCRNVHTDAEWRNNAERVCVELGAFVHELNTHYGLYTQLRKALDTNVIASSGTTSAKQSDNIDIALQSSPIDRETLLVGRMLQRDFERYGVHLDGALRDRMATLVAQSQLLGFTFSQNIIDPQKCGQLLLKDAYSCNALQELPYVVQRMFRPLAADGVDGRIGGFSAPGLSGTLHAVTTYSNHESLRQAAYDIYTNYPRENIEVLDRLLTVRHEIATLMGYKSYSEYQLDEFSLASKPGAVWEFLTELSTAIQPAAELEMEQLLLMKKKHSCISSVDDIQDLQLRPWDRDWAIQMLGQQENSPQRLLSQLNEHLTLEGCLHGISELLEHLLGVRLQEEIVKDPRGEFWAPGVRKYLIQDISNDDGILGTMYLDLYRRTGKFPGAAHFTLRCGRRPTPNTIQTPVVALVMNFPSPGSDDTDSFTQGELETLLHELGHALNSLLSKTRYQHLSGTRGPQDIIEIPSHVFERFSCDADALGAFAFKSQNLRASKYANPPSTNDDTPNLINIGFGNAIDINNSAYLPVPDLDLLKAPLANKRQHAALILQSTIGLCFVDQLLHGENPPIGNGPEAMEKAVNEVLQRSNPLAAVPSGQSHHPQVRFNHLVGYGGNYYCYPFAQCISAAVWEQASQEKGEDSWPTRHVLRQRMLQSGGAKPAEELVQGLFIDDQNGTELLVRAKDGGTYPKIDALLRYLELD